jgi:hypothetical protein
MTTSTTEPVRTYTQAEIDAHLAKIVAAATKRHERAPRRASARVIDGKIRCQLDFTSRSAD